MSNARSPLGELVVFHRSRQGYTRTRLADRGIELSAKGLIDTPVSSRTLGRIERITTPDQWHRPHIQSVIALAAMLDLTPGTPEHDAFIDAGLNLSASTVNSPNDTSPQRADHASQGHNFVIAGRERQLERISAVIDAAANGRSSVAGVSGNPGIGKTSIIAEACRRALARHEDLTLYWTAVHYRPGPPLPWEPFRELLSQMLGDFSTIPDALHVPRSDSQHRSDRITEAVRLVIRDAPALIELLPPGTLEAQGLTGTLPPDLHEELLDPPERVDGSQSPIPIDTAFAHLITSLADNNPTVLVIEDLHWADTSTLHTISQLVQRIATHNVPLAIIGSWRPVDLATAYSESTPLVRVLRDAFRRFPGANIDLSSSAGGEAGRSFVDAVVAANDPDDPVAVSKVLFERTMGVPLAVVNLLRLLGERPLTADALRALPVPEEIPMVFAGQVEQLDEAVRELLTAASVQGETFWAEPVMDMLGMDRDQFIDIVDSRLVRQFRMLDALSVEMIGPHRLHRYAFSHAMLRDYLVNILSEMERERWHERTARALIKLLGETNHTALERIAVHFDESGNRDRGARAWLQAGLYVLEHRELDRAIAAFERVLAHQVLHADPETHIDAMIGLGNCYRGQANIPASRDILHQAMDLATSHNLPIQRGSALEALAMVDMDTGDTQLGVDRLRQSIDIWTSANHDEVARAMTNLSYLLYNLGRYEEAMDFAQRSASMAHQNNDTREWVSARIGFANCLMDLGHYEEAASVYRPCLRAAENAGLEHLASICRVNLTLAAVESGDWVTARHHAHQAMQGPNEPAPHLVAFLEHHLGLAAEATGDLDAAGAHFGRSRDLRERTRHAVLIDALSGLLRVAVAQEDVDEARALHDAICGWMEEKGIDGVEHPARLYLALVGAARLLGDKPAAERYRQAGVAFVRERANGISNSNYRKSWLERPSANQQMLSLTPI